MTLTAFLLLFGTTAKAQEQVVADSMDVQFTSIKADSIFVASDTIIGKPKRDWSTWRPNPKRAMWLAIVLPGADRYTTASIGNCRSCMADSLVAPMPCVGTTRCIPTIRKRIST